MEELLKQHLEARKVFNETRIRLIEEMKKQGIKRLNISDTEWITYYPSHVKENIWYHKKELEETGE